MDTEDEVQSTDKTKSKSKQSDEALNGMKLASPTPIQCNTIPAALQGRNVVGASPTGSGKTLCFAVPILQSLASDPYGIHSLILTPTRELAFQIGEQFRALGSKIKVRVQVVVGGMDATDQSLALSQIPHIVIATPGRLLEFLRYNTIKDFSLSRIKFLVLDEADRLLSKYFQDELEEITAMLPSIEKRQTLLFSATMTDNLKKLGTLSGMSNSFFFDATHEDHYLLPPTLTSEYILVPPTVKDAYLVFLLKQFSELTSIIIFVSTKEDCETVHVMLQDLEFSTSHLHSFMRQDQRNRTLNQIKSGLVQILVATDIASRGLDIPTVQLVINYNVPHFVEEFVHRVGRTARAGRKGRAITLVTQFEVEHLLNIEKKTGKQLTEFAHNEEEALLSLNKALTAKQVAILHLNDNGFMQKLEKYNQSKEDRKQEKLSKNKDKTENKEDKEPEQTIEKKVEKGNSENNTKTREKEVHGEERKRLQEVQQSQEQKQKQTRKKPDKQSLQQLPVAKKQLKRKHSLPSVHASKKAKK